MNVSDLKTLRREVNGRALKTGLANTSSRPFINTHRDTNFRAIIGTIENDVPKFRRKIIIDSINELKQLKTRKALNLSDPNIRAKIKSILARLEESATHLSDFENVEQAVLYDQISVLYELSWLFHQFASKFLYLRKEGGKFASRARSLGRHPEKFYQQDKKLIWQIVKEFLLLFKTIKKEVDIELNIADEEAKGKKPPGDFLAWFHSKTFGPKTTVKVQLRELEQDRFISRYGQNALKKVFDAMKEWNLPGLKKALGAATRPIMHEILLDKRAYKDAVIFFIETAETDNMLVQIIRGTGIMEHPECRELATSSNRVIQTLNRSQMGLRDNSTWTRKREEDAKRVLKSFFTGLTKTKNALEAAA